jgi:hypothetical protein
MVRGVISWSVEKSKQKLLVYQGILDFVLCNIIYKVIRLKKNFKSKIYIKLFLCSKAYIY